MQVKHGDNATTMERIASKASGYTYYDTYRLADGTEFGVYRDHFQVRCARGTPVLVVNGSPVIVVEDAGPTNAEEMLAALLKADIHA